MRAGKIQFDRISPHLDNSWDFGAMKRNSTVHKKALLTVQCTLDNEYFKHYRAKKMLYTAH